MRARVELEIVPGATHLFEEPGALEAVAACDQLVPAAHETGAYVSIREIPRAEWRACLDQFSRQHRAWLASVDRLGRAGDHQMEVVERPLATVAVEAGGGGPNIHIQFLDAPASDAVVIEAPVGLSVEESERGAARGLEIADRNGERTRITLRVAEPPGLLDGIAPGEL